MCELYYTLFGQQLTVRYADGSNFGAALDSDLVLSVNFKQCGRADQQALRETTEVIIGQRNEFAFTAEEKSTEKDSSNDPLCYSVSDFKNLLSH